MAMVTVLHRNNPETFNPIYKPVDFSAVAIVDVPSDKSTSDIQALDYAYQWTQNLEGSWSLKEGPSANHHVHLIGTPYYTLEGERVGLRSTMMDDLMILNGKVYQVSFIGFEESKI